MNKQLLCSTRQFVPLKNEKGQVSIFLGISLLIVVTFLAFIVNVGLFVKAKINLQNSVDAAAYAGAAVQARQLTDIAYLNWELRNTYKEWMFKYYVLGQKGMSATHREKLRTELNPSGKMNFRLRPFYEQGEPGYDMSAFDPFNVPSICVSYGSSRNICEILRIPGLPRFNSQGLPGVSEILEASLNTLVATKSKDCADRTSVNMGAAMLWAYGTGSDSLFSGVPLIAANRVGAWVEAVELAIRMRNLESFVNAPPQTTPVCLTGSGCQQIQAITQTASTPLFERVNKAFWSAYRNLSGGIYKGKGSDFASTFKLTELAPNPYQANPDSLSGFLIPPSHPAMNKYYLDLEMNPVNFVTFYTSFISMTGEFRNSSVAQEADCGGTKTALPVPGYILGFTKNPKVMTYYALKGEAKFTGLFNPFNPSGINLKAYAAAKPFGGRIGPKLFKAGPNGQALFPREEANKNYSANYITTLDDVAALAASSTKINPGFPLPLDPGFWARSTGANVSIGGIPRSGVEVFFGVPNLIYDFNDPSQLEIPKPPSSRNINVLKKAQDKNSAYSLDIFQGTSGLYDVNQFEFFESNQYLSGTAIMEAHEVYASLNRARKPTAYDAINYLIPVINPQGGGQNPLNTESNIYVQSLGDTNPDSRFNDSFFYKIYAPLHGPETLYDSENAIIAEVNAFINSNSGARDKYTAALKAMADQMKQEAASTATSSDAYLAAAQTVYSEPLVISDSSSCANISMAQKFATFFNTGPGGCGITPLSQNLRKYFSNGRPDRGDLNALFRDFHIGIFTHPTPDSNQNTRLLTAYMPGERKGVQGSFTGLPYGDQDKLAKRNTYSAKFFALDRVLDGSSNPIDQDQFIFMEGSPDRAFKPSGDMQSVIINKLSPAQISEFSDNLFF